MLRIDKGMFEEHPFIFLISHDQNNLHSYRLPILHFVSFNR